MSRYVPWPHPLAAGTVLGIGAAAALPLGWKLVAGALAILLGVSLLWRRGWRWPATLADSGPRAFAVFLGPCLVAAGVGAVLLARHEARPDPLAGRFGQQETWTGYSDGGTLHATSPVRARLALVAPSEGWPGGKAPIGSLAVVGVAERPPGRSNPGGFDYAGHLRRRGVTGQLFVTGFEQRSVVLPLKQRLQRGVVRGLSPPAAALMAAMTLGVRDDLGDLRDAFSASGLAHVLALSGLHVGVLLVALERLLTPLGRWRTPLLVVATVGFVALVGASPSVVRAATMTLAALGSRAFGAGRVMPWTAMSLAALVGLLTAPQMLFDLSFQLSYLAVAGMLLFLPPWLKRLGATGEEAESAAGAGGSVVVEPEAALLRMGSARASTVLRAGARRATLARRRLSTPALRRYVLGGLAVSAAAQLPSLSLVAGSFGVVPLSSPVINIVAVPLAGLLVPLGFLAGILGSVAPPLAHAVNLLVQPMAASLILLAEFGALLPSVAWGEVGWLGHACWAAFLVALAAWAHRRGRLKHTALVALVAGGVTLAVPAALPPPDVWYLDVGQGDAVLIRLPGGQGVMVDGGGSPFSDFDVGESVVLPALRALGVTRLAAVVATHPDADHVEGLLPVLERMPVGLLVTGPPNPQVALDAELRRVAERRGVPVHVAQRGERLVLPGGRLRLDILNPAAAASGMPVNEASVAFVLRYRGAARALFLGDLGVATEPDLGVPPVELLMVGHHGSRNSTGEALVRAAQPRVAVVSVGRNGYGHPAPDVLERLTEAGAQVLTTQLHGAVRFDLSGRASVVTLATPAGPAGDP